MDALKDELIGVFAQVQDALHAHDSFAEFGDQFAKPLAQLYAIQIARRRDGHGFDIFGVLVVVVVLFRFDFEIESCVDPSTVPISTSEFRVWQMRAAPFRLRILYSSSGKSSGLMRSILLSSTMSAKAICSFASGDCFSCW